MRSTLLGIFKRKTIFFYIFIIGMLSLRVRTWKEAKRNTTEQCFYLLKREQENVNSKDLTRALPDCSKEERVRVCAGPTILM